MATTKVINMTARTSSNLAYDEYLYLTGETPIIDNKMQASVLRDFVLSGVDPGLGLTKTTTAYSAANPVATLDLDVSGLTALPSVDVTGSDYLVIEDTSAPVGSKSKKVLISALGPHVGDITDVVAGTNLNGGGAGPGSVTLNLETTITGLTSVASTGFTGALTGNATTATALETSRNISGVAFDGSAAITLLMTGLGDVDGGMSPLDGQILTYDTTVPAGWTAKNVAGTGTVTSVGVVGTTGIVVDPTTTPVTGSGTIALSLSGVPNSALDVIGVTKGGTGLTGIAKGGVIVSTAVDTFGAVLGGALEDGFVLTYNQASDTITWENHPGSAGDVAGPASAVDNSVARFDSTTGKIIQDTGVNFVISDLGAVTAGSWTGTAIGDTYISSAATWNAKQNALTFGIADTNSIVIDSATVASADYAKFTVSGVEGRSATEVKTDLSLSNVEDTALSTWTGSTNVTTLGTIATGTWEGTTVAVDQGGTGQTSYTDGQLLIGNTTGNTLTKATLTEGANITITEAAGSITIAAAAGGDPAGTAVAMAIALGG